MNPSGGLVPFANTELSSPTLSDLNEHAMSTLRIWGARWHLDAPWCLDQARMLLLNWGLAPKMIGTWWDFPELYLERSDLRGIGFSHRSESKPWDSLRQTWQSYAEERLAEVDAYRAEVEASLAAYRASMEAQALEGGLIRTTSKALGHFTWLAIFQTSDLSLSDMLEIAHRDQPSLKASGLKQALASAARMIELPLRPSPHKGRKTGTRDKEGSRVEIVRHRKGLSISTRSSK